MSMQLPSVLQCRLRVEVRVTCAVVRDMQVRLVDALSIPCTKL